MEMFLLAFIAIQYVSCNDVTVTTDVGVFTGAAENITYNGRQVTATSFLGIPFAEPPVGDRRFQKPIAKATLATPFDAKNMPPACPQNSRWYSTQATPIPMDEDCLYLNIFIPGDSVDGNQPKAVMVWIYGGSFTMGWQSLLASPQFAGLNDVVYVTMNYRVNAFGFLSHDVYTNTGNYGLWDQQLAIQWVHDHITAFGGDADRITIFGNSAGGSSVILQTLYAGNTGLFQRAISMSGSASSYWALQVEPAKNFKNFAKVKGCDHDDPQDVLHCLRQLPYEDLISDSDAISMFTPTIDGEFVKIKARDIFKNESVMASQILTNFGDLDYMFGVVSDEGGNFASRLNAAVTAMGGNVSEGVSLEMMPHIIDVMLEKFRLPDTEVAQAAVLQEYVDWSNPDNLAKNREGLLQFYTDMIFNVPTINAANRHATHGDGTSYVYLFDHRPSYSSMPSWLLGASHADDDCFVLAFPAETLLRWYDVTDMEDPDNGVLQSEFDLAKDVMLYWTNFAKTGNPNTGENSAASGLTNWPVYTTSSQQYIVLNMTGLTGQFPRNRRLSAAGLAFRNNLLPAIKEQCERAAPVSSASGITPSSVFSLLFGIILWL